MQLIKVKTINLAMKDQKSNYILCSQEESFHFPHQPLAQFHIIFLYKDLVRLPLKPSIFT